MTGTDIATIDRDFAPTPRSGITAVVLDGEVVLYDEWTHGVHALNQSASIVWSLLDGETTLAAIADVIATATDADPVVVADDVLALARMLGELGVLHGIDPASVEPPGP